MDGDRGGCRVKSTCPYCGVGCGVLLTPDGAGGLTVKGDPDHPANSGRLCSKGTSLVRALGLDDRLLAPGIGGTEAAWDAALRAGRRDVHRRDPLNMGPIAWPSTSRDNC